MIDVVYVLGRGSIWGDKEIRYSLRSIEKHLKEYRDVYIVGHLPNFLQGVRYISFNDPHHCKETNIYGKVLRACQEASISDDFLFFNDDHFLISDFVAKDFPFYYKGDLRQSSKRLRYGHGYKAAIDNTYRALQNRGLPSKNFDSHCPIVYNKKFILDNLVSYDWSTKVTFILKSLYANTKLIDGERQHDCKVNSQHDIDKLKIMIRSKNVFSMGNGAIGPPMLQLLEELYPTPSRWEKI